MSKVLSAGFTFCATPETMYFGASTTLAKTWGRSRTLPLLPASWYFSPTTSMTTEKNRIPPCGSDVTGITRFPPTKWTSKW